MAARAGNPRGRPDRRVRGEPLVARGRFLSLEGIDGSGKSTQAAMLTEALRGSGVDVVGTREPGGTALGEALREVLLARQPGEIAPLAEAHLFAAARGQLVAEVIRPALVVGRWVVADRYVDSSLAYQGLGRGLGVDTVRAINRPVVEGCMPDLTLLVDVSVELASSRRCMPDRIEAEGPGFQQRVADGYLELAAAEPARIRPIAGDATPDEVHRTIMAQVREAT